MVTIKIFVYAKALNTHHSESHADVHNLTMLLQKPYLNRNDNIKENDKKMR